MLKLKALESRLSAVVRPFERPRLELEQYPTSSHLAAHLLYTAASHGDLSGRDVVDLGVGCGMLSAGAYLLGARHLLGVDVDAEALRQTREAFARLRGDSDDDPDGRSDEHQGEEGMGEGEEGDGREGEEQTIEFLLADIPSLLPGLLGSADQPTDAPDGPDGSASGVHPARTGASPSTSTKHIRLGPRCCDTVVMNPPFGTKANAGIDMAFLHVAARLARTAIYTLHKSSTRTHVLREGERAGWRGEVVAELRYDLPCTYKHHRKRSVDIQVDFLRFVREEE